MQFPFVLLLFRPQIFLRLLSQKLGEALLVFSQAFPQLPQFQLYDLFYRICPDIMARLAGASVFFLVVGAYEEVNVFVDGIGVIPQLPSAVGTIQQIRKDVLFGVLRLWRPSLRFCNQLLYALKSIPVNERLMNILEDRPVFYGISQPGFVLEGLGVG